MASISASSAAVATPGQLILVAPFTGLKSNAAFPVTKKSNNDFSSLPSNGGRVQCMKVLKELNECKKEYPNAFIRIISFDNVRQVQCISFIAHRPKGF
ncbi:Ribulose-1,5-bisphosphate carboxylase small subunit, N-terminal [Cynara cardunculus var. scolymus]|uniref:Ribulose bisphosphate carboxylase small subunit n=1 Tax=Cynara cardunculus var. scolymus TaxID=59895 RepID=A0A118JM49_CYNCS|nr:Ribulose-1,5-bisphosphate carboxylase small subunit, N-terminal [Cynara cardunculus var. scolymus]